MMQNHTGSLSDCIIQPQHVDIMFAHAGLHSGECKDTKSNIHMFTSLTLRLLPLCDVHNACNQVYGVDYIYINPHPHFLRAFTLTAHHIPNCKLEVYTATLCPCYLEARYAIPAQVATKRSTQIGYVLTTQNI
jgi:hypothetical protein